jgi:hypothetical protein
VTGLNGHVVLIGLGSVGMRVLTGLLAAHREVRNLGASVVIGNATLPQTLDLTNLEIALALRKRLDSAGSDGREPPLVLRLLDRRLARLSVAAGGGLDGSSMQELSELTRVIALDRAGGGGLEHPPRRGTRVAAGDAAYLVGPYEELLDVLQRDQSGST